MTLEQLVLELANSVELHSHCLKEQVKCNDNFISAIKSLGDTNRILLERIVALEAKVTQLQQTTAPLMSYN